MRRESRISARHGSFLIACLAPFVIATSVLVACHAAPGPEATRPLATDVEAVSLLGDSLRRPPLDSAAQARMEAQLVQARRDAAAQPNDPDALIWVGRRTAYLGRFGEAIAIFSDGIRRFPADARMYRHRGHRYISVRRFDDAIADLQRAATLTTGKADQVEPDGQPNARNIPIGSLQSNIWYHLALAHYLKGDWDNAARAARAGIDVSTNPDRLVSQTHWLYMAMRRAGRNSEATAALAPIRDDFEVIENASYYRLLKMYKGVIGSAEIDSAVSAGVRSAADASLAYGLGNWFLYNGDTARATRVYERLLAAGQWASFGYIAAEVDLSRMRRAR
jgi:tetratricopeptide (TPR) repeat protein